MSSGKWRPFCLGLNVLIISDILWHSPQGNFTGNAIDVLKIMNLASLPILQGPNEFKQTQGSTVKAHLVFHVCLRPT